jgi:HSP20 family protein
MEDQTMFPQRFYPTRGSFQGLRRDLNRLFDDLSEGAQALSPFRTRAFPAINVWEDNENLYAEVEVPGLTLEDLDVHVIGGELSIKGSYQESVDSNDARVHRQERWSGSFTRALTLPTEIDTDKVEATLKDGVLNITMPKADVARARKIAVKGE